jgi:hypothetical protein
MRGLPARAQKSFEMKKATIWFCLGFVTASVFFAFVILPDYLRRQAEGFQRAAETEAKYNFMKKIEAELGDDYRGSDGYNVFFEVKADAVVIVERNGVKTLRSYVAGRK